jgi:hypothetical protein
VPPPYPPPPRPPRGARGGAPTKQLVFDDEGKLKLSRVNRQMTQDEQDMFVNPGIK